MCKYTMPTQCPVKRFHLFYNNMELSISVGSWFSLIRKYTMTALYIWWTPMRIVTLKRSPFSLSSGLAHTYWQIKSKHQTSLHQSCQPVQWIFWASTGGRWYVTHLYDLCGSKITGNSMAYIRYLNMSSNTRGRTSKIFLKIHVKYYSWISNLRAQ